MGKNKLPPPEPELKIIGVLYRETPRHPKIIKTKKMIIIIKQKKKRKKKEE